jgi:integrase
MSETPTAMMQECDDHAIVASLLAPIEPKQPKARAQKRGMGRTFQRGGKWWIAYYLKKDGRSVEVRESAGTTEADAKRALKRRQDQLGAHRSGARPFQGPQQERVTVWQLLENLERDYTLRGMASLQQLRAHLKHIKAYFGNDRALEVTPARVGAYMELRLEEGAANATVNREVEGLQRALTLAVEQTVLTTMPHFKSLPEWNARQGFFERADFESVLPRLTRRGKPDTDLQDYMSWCFYTGMRAGETKSLTWADFDMESQTIRLHAKDSKNRKGRAIPLMADLLIIVERRVKARRLDCPYIFHRNGKRMGEFRKVWRRACEEAGVNGKLFHDLRRSAVRNMIRAGVNPDIARQISGHRTPAIFSRYNIIDEADLRRAIEQTSGYLAGLPVKSNVLLLRTMADATGTR